MKILDIELKTPSTVDLVMAVLAAALVLGVGSLFIELTPQYVVGAIAGSVAFAYGVSIVEHGWRGMVVISGFFLGMVAIVTLLEWLVG